MTQTTQTTQVQRSHNQNSKASSGFDSLAAPNFIPPLPVEPVLLAPSLPLRGGPPNRPLPLPRAAGLLLADDPTQPAWQTVIHITYVLDELKK